MQFLQQHQLRAHGSRRVQLGGNVALVVVPGFTTGHLYKGNGQVRVRHSPALSGRWRLELNRLRKLHGQTVQTAALLNQV